MTTEIEIPPCDECARITPDICVQYAFDGTRIAQCRECYVMMRQRERAKA